MTKTTSKSESGRAKLAPGAGVQSGPAGRPASEAVTLARQSETGRNGPGSRRRVRRRRVHRGRPAAARGGPTASQQAAGRAGCVRVWTEPHGLPGGGRGDTGAPSRGGEGRGAAGAGGSTVPSTGARGGQEGRVHLQLPTLVLGPAAG